MKFTFLCIVKDPLVQFLDFFFCVVEDEDSFVKKEISRNPVAKTSLL